MPAATFQTGVIELRLGSVAQLFHTLDPAPFRHGDLSAEAEAHIVDTAQELPAKAPLGIILYLPPKERANALAADVPEAIREFLKEQARLEAVAKRQLFLDGRTALAIGLIILAACLFLSWRMEEGLLQGAMGRLAQESLVIFGWVAIWRPAEMFLYDWLSFERRRKLCLKLAEAEVTVVS